MAEKQLSFTRSEIIQAQKLWADGIVAIGAAYSRHKDYGDLALKFVDRVYAYCFAPVLFKPTRAAAKPFRLTAEAALSYFIGGNREFPEDRGFALNPWAEVRFENAGFIMARDHALAMGRYRLRDPQGRTTIIEYTFGYLRNVDGRLAINLHHSSLPYSG